MAAFFSSSASGIGGIPWWLFALAVVYTLIMFGGLAWLICRDNQRVRRERDLNLTLGSPDVQPPTKPPRPPDVM